MRKAIFIVVAALGVILSFQMVAYGDGADSTQEISASSNISIQQMDLMPLAFTENHGQWDDRVQFKANAAGATMWFTTDGVYYQFTRRISHDETLGAPQLAVGSIDGKVPQQAVGHPLDHESDNVEQLMIKASFVRANLNPEIVGENVMQYKCNYFIGNDPNEWHTDVPNYKAVVFKDVYSGIDLKYFGNGKQMEYDFIVSPGADPNQIMVQYDGARSISVNDAGELVVETEWGNVTELRPLIYQFDANGCMPIDGRYVLFTDNTFGFDLGDRYDPTHALVIDPVLSYSTYLGGGDEDVAYSIAVDSIGDCYVTGRTKSSNFPSTPGVHDETFNAPNDVFVSKISQSELVYSTFVGGPNNYTAQDIVVDDSGYAYVAGESNGVGFPTTPGVVDSVASGVEGILFKLSPAGDELIFSTYLGAGGSEAIHGIALDSDRRPILTGWTTSSGFYTSAGAHDRVQNGGTDAFVTKLCHDATCYVFSTFLGGNNTDEADGIAVDSANDIYVTGITTSSDLSVGPGFDLTSNPVEDAFLVKVSSDGSSVLCGTYLGGSGREHGRDLTLGQDSSVYVTGYTESSNFPTWRALYGTRLGASDAFVTKLDCNCDSTGMSYSTYLGGDGGESGYGIDVDSDGNAYVIGGSYSGNFPTVNAVSDTYGGEGDAFLTAFSKDGSSLLSSSYLGGSGWEVGYDIQVGDSNKVYVTGRTSSDNFPMAGDPYDDEFNGSSDVLVAIIGTYCVDSDGDGFGDPGHPENSCPDDNCPNDFNPLQEDGDSDGIGDSCDVCPDYYGDDCCDPTEANESPVITSESEVSVQPGDTFNYTATASDPNCDGTELLLSIEDKPSWCVVDGNNISGTPECDYADTSFVVIASDGELSDTLEVVVTIDLSNQPPVIDNVEQAFVQNQATFTYYPEIDDPDDTEHTITYLNYPHWCGISNDSVLGTAPDTAFFENLTVIVEDYCNADTLSFTVRIFLCGDVDASGFVDIDDVVGLINYIFAGGPAPEPIESGDADCSDFVDIDDVVYLINYIFAGGPSPCNPDGEGEPDCLLPWPDTRGL